MDSEDSDVFTGLDEDMDEGTHKRLVENVLNLSKRQDIKKPSRTEPVLQVSEFNLVKSITGHKGQIRISDLTKVLKKQKAKHIDLEKKVKSAQTRAKTLQKPLEKPQAERIKRSVAYGEVKKQFDKWDAAVTSNRAANTLSFPLEYDTKLEQEVLARTPYRLKSNLQKKLEELEPKVEVYNVDLAFKEKKHPLTMQEMMDKRKEGAKLRAHQSYKESKARRQNKIKSKKYHRIQRKERVKLQMQEFEMLKKTDPEAALKKLEEIEIARAEERLTLRHKSTGQWAKNKQVRAKYDKESRQALAQQLSIGKELTQKLKVNESSDSEDEGKVDDVPASRTVNENDPWSKMKTSQEIDDFVSSYRKFWENNNLDKEAEKDREVEDKEAEDEEAEEDKEVEGKEAEEDNEMNEDKNPEVEVNVKSTFKENGDEDNINKQDMNGLEIKENGTNKKDVKKNANKNNVNKKRVNEKIVNQKNVIEIIVNTKKVNTQNVNIKKVNTPNVNTKKVNTQNINTNNINTNNINTKNINTNNINTNKKVKKNINKMDISSTSEWDVSTASDLEENEDISSEDGEDIDNSEDEDNEEFDFTMDKLKKEIDKRHKILLKELGNTKKGNKGSKLKQGNNLKEGNNLKQGNNLKEGNNLKQANKLNNDKSKKNKRGKIDLTMRKEAKRPVIDEELDEHVYNAKEGSSEYADLLKLKSIINDTQANKQNTNKQNKNIQNNNIQNNNIQNNTRQNNNRQNSSININPNEITNLKPVALTTELPDLTSYDDNEENALQSGMLAEAFEDEDIIDEFKKDKQAAIDKDKPKDVDLSLPGWGSWGGHNIKVNKRKRRRFIIKMPKTFPRRDENKGDLVINENTDASLKAHLVSELPFPFTSVKDYEASIRAPIGNTFVPETAYRKLIHPAVTTRIGAIIEPLTDDILVKRMKKR